MSSGTLGERTDGRPLSRPDTLDIGLNRRAVLTGTLAAGASAVAAKAALAQDGSRFSSVLVDVGPLRAKGLGPFAELVRASLQAELGRAYADRLGREGPRLVVRVDAVSMSFYAGREGGRFGMGGTSTDYLDGEALVVGSRGEILARHPQLSAVPANSGGAWYDPASEPRRVVALAAHFVGWLRRAPL